MIPNKLKPFLALGIFYLIWKSMKAPARKARKAWNDSEKPFNQWYEMDRSRRYGYSTPKRKNEKKKPMKKKMNSFDRIGRKAKAYKKSVKNR